MADLEGPTEAMLEAIRVIREWSEVVDLSKYQQECHTHTCGVSLPPKRDCPACQAYLRWYCNKYHLSTPLALFGWDIMAEHYLFYLQSKTHSVVG